MKKTILFLTAILGVAFAKAAESNNPQNDSSVRAQKIKESLETLIDAGMISKSDNQCIQINENLLEALRLEGILIPSNHVTPQSICILPPK